MDRQSPRANEILSLVEDIREIVSHTLYKLDLKINEIESEVRQKKATLAIPLYVKENQEASADLQNAVSEVLGEA